MLTSCHSPARVRDAQLARLTRECEAEAVDDVIETALDCSSSFAPVDTLKRTAFSK